MQAIDLDEGRTFGIPTISPVNVADTIARITDTLGPSTADTAWLPMPAEFACTGNLAFRTVWWNDFRMTFENGSSGEQTTAWSLGDPSASLLSPLGDVPAVETASGVTTIDGIGIGTSGDELRSRLSSRVIVDDDTDVVVVATGALVTRFTLSDGIVNGIGSGRLDCLGTDEGL